MEAFIAFLTSTGFIVNCILGVLLIEYALFKVRVPRHIKEERDSKFPAFRRTDAKYWTRPRLYLAAPILFPRFMLTISIPIVWAILTYILLIGQKRGVPKPAWKTLVFNHLTRIVSKLVLYCGCGMFYYKFEEVNKDYSKYLGPDYKPNLIRASSYVCNHSCWIDILIANCSL
jgi:hypothetical protein